MSARHGCFLAALIPLLLPPPIVADESFRKDRYGDPLPPGAVARIGTIRFQHGSTVMQAAFSPDGKTLISLGYDGVRIWEAGTGKPLRELTTKLAFPSFRSAVFSRDGKAVWLWEQGQDQNEGVLKQWDWAKGPEEKPRSTSLKGMRADCLALSPDGKILACRHPNGVRLWDVKADKEIRLLKSTFGAARRLEFSASGKILGCLGVNSTVIRWDTASGKEVPGLQIHSQMGDFTLRGDDKFRTAYYTGRDQSIRVHECTSESEPGKELCALTSAEKHPLQLVLSPDGKHVALVGHQMLYLWEVESGKKLWEHEPKSQFYFATFSADGKSIAATEGSQVRVWDVASGKEHLAAPDAGQDVYFLSLLAKGQRVAWAGTEGPLRLWDIPQGKEIPFPQGRRWRGEHIAGLSRDGQTLVSVDHKEMKVLIWDVPAGRLRHELPFAGRILCCDLTPDGKQLLLDTQAINRRRPEAPGPFHLWDVHTGEEVRQFRGPDEMRLRLYSPDSNYLAISRSDWSVRVWDLQGGRQVRTLTVAGDSVHEMAISPDGRLLAGAGGGQQKLWFWELASGKPVLPFKPEQPALKVLGGLHALAFSPDGRRLFSGDYFGQIYYWDVGGPLLHEWKAHSEGGVFRLWSSDDGSTLVSRGTTALIWNLAEVLPREKPKPGHLTENEAKALWSELKADDATQAYRAIWKLADAPAASVTLLRQQLHPADKPDPENVPRIREWISKLDDDSFAVREEATRQLKAMGSEAVPQLQKALANRPSAEMKKRAEELLSQLREPSDPPPSPEQLRNLRALAVLEYIGNEQARGLLQTIAQGNEQARLTREAKASLTRLAKRKER